MKRLLGGLLLAVGILIAALSGLCSLVFGVPMLSSANDSEGIWGMLGLIVIWGGIPFAIGLGLFYAGRRLLRRDDTLETLE